MLRKKKNRWWKVILFIVTIIIPAILAILLVPKTGIINLFLNSKGNTPENVEKINSWIIVIEIAWSAIVLIAPLLYERNKNRKLAKRYVDFVQYAKNEFARSLGNKFDERFTGLCMSIVIPEKSIILFLAKCYAVLISKFDDSKMKDNIPKFYKVINVVKDEETKFPDGMSFNVNTFNLQGLVGHAISSREPAEYDVKNNTDKMYDNLCVDQMYRLQNINYALCIPITQNKWKVTRAKEITVGAVLLYSSQKIEPPIEEKSIQELATEASRYTYDLYNIMKKDFKPCVRV